MLRHVLLMLARSRQVKEIVTRMPVSSGIVNRYVPGEHTDDAVSATKVQIDDGLHVTLDFLGEDTLDEAHAESTVVAYLEKSGFGAKAAAPVVKCMFTALGNPSMMAPVLPSDPLDLTSLLPAPPTQLADSSCMPAAVDARD